MMTALVDVLPVPVAFCAATTVVPEERSETVEYVNEVVVLAPVAFTVPFNVASVGFIDVAAFVVTTGAPAGTKLMMLPSKPVVQVWFGYVPLSALVHARIL